MLIEWKGISDGGPADDHEMLWDYFCEVIEEIYDEFEDYEVKVVNFYLAGGEEDGEVEEEGQSS